MTCEEQRCWISVSSTLAELILNQPECAAATLEGIHPGCFHPDEVTNITWHDHPNLETVKHLGLYVIAEVEH